VHVTDSMIYASATGLSNSLTSEEKKAGSIYPALDRIREISLSVARDVIRAAQKEGVDKKKELQWLSDPELEEYIAQRMYDPSKATASRAGSRAESPVPGVELNGVGGKKLLAVGANL
jgi:malate dehydrogenase (oxaloacetate-decarboxylating)(NADP+)